MDDKQRYSMPRNSLAMTRSQWVAFGIAMTLAVAGLVIGFTLRAAIGAMIAGVATLTGFLILGFGQRPDDRV